MSGIHGMLEGIGTGQIERIVVGKLAVDTDLLAGILELIKRERIRTGLFLSAVGALKKATFRNIKTMPSALHPRTRDLRFALGDVEAAKLEELWKSRRALSVRDFTKSG